MHLPPSVIRAGLRASRPLFASRRVSLAAKRRLVDGLTRATVAPRGTVATRGDVAGVPVAFATPPGVDPHAALLYVHGGGFALGTAGAYAGFAARVAAAAGATAVVPEYRLAPEHPYPAGLDDVHAVYLSLLADGQDPRQLVVVGDSAGGGLTLSLLQRLRDAGAPLPAAAGLLSPWVDLVPDARRTRAAGSDPLLDPVMLNEWVAPYAGSRDPRDPGISPLHGDLSGLPPIVLHSGADDPLVTDALALERRLRQTAGAGTVEHRSWPGRWHVFHLQAGFLADADAAVAELGARLARHAARAAASSPEESKYPLDNAPSAA